MVEIIVINQYGKVRIGWETSSSSVHTVSIAKEGMEPSKLPLDKNGYIITRFGEFDGEERMYGEQEDKLSYIMTCLWYCSGSDVGDIFENWYFKDIEEALCKYTGAKGIRIVGGNPYIDHQSAPEYGESRVVNLWNTDEVLEFIFNKFIYLHTWHD